ncbi:amino acid ABC transporter substrate-binding protein [Bacillus sp. AFS076308]|uniref:amino acid ABC transporter substrate-binding protein n=1 Tax=unclassified Bacillus (in: firmicutes) TaxID=185979 RepID=UPI000BF71121|nr:MULTISPECIES: amino acid ABC transporter substrate-binding protein [unclassified Bacillus (in: firmicutes)]PFO02589.1 amino acid ABC transporter substrate-binding protein [Bacillus sp. AFS076308]PGV55482.1 amino acid ABC transporter substrate-binding protein [Bacillus sp. AFS037270]
MKKLTVIFALLLSFMLVLSACGKDEKEDQKRAVNTEEKKTADNQDLLKKIQDDGKITIGTEGTYPPFTFHDTSGNLTGFDVDLANEVAKRLGVKAEYKETQWDAMFAGLDAKRFDMIANEVGIRPDRQKKYDFSDPYITSAGVLIVNTSNTKVKKFEDIKGLNAAQSLTSNYGDMAKKYGANLVGVEGFQQAVELLTQKRVDVTINDKLTYLDYKKQKPDAPIKIAATANDASSSGFMFRKNSDKLVDEVNKALKEMVDDGTYKKISEKWFGEDVLK